MLGWRGGEGMHLHRLFLHAKDARRLAVYGLPMSTLLSGKKAIIENTQGWCISLYPLSLQCA